MRRIIGSKNGVGSATSGRVLLGGAHDRRERRDGDESVNVCAQVDLDHVALLQQNVDFAAHRRKVAHAVVHREACGEGDALLQVLVLFVELLEG